MKKLALIAAAAVILTPSVAAAQHRGGSHGGGQHGGPRPGGGGHHGGGGWNGGGWNGGGWNGGFNRGGSFGGFAFGGFFSQPQYHVQNWQVYGFLAPAPQQYWVRYYDDAYLVDGRGYIYDARRGVAWDRYGERWEHDANGVPYYAGDEDDYADERYYREEERDHRYGGGCDRRPACGPDGRRDVVIERHRGGDGRRVIERRYEHEGRGYDGRGYEGRGDVRTRVYVTPGAPAPCGPHGGCGAPGAYGYGGYSTGYGSSYGYGAGNVIVTETTVTQGEQVVTEEIIEEVVEDRAVRRRHRAAPRRHVAPAPRRHPAPRPAPQVVQPSGERG